MLEAQTITTLGEVLGRDLGTLRRTAIEHLTLPELSSYESLEASLETLLDRLCLSLNLAKPVGLLTWGEREAMRVGPAGVTDMVSAATQAISTEASRFSLDNRRVLASLEVLAGEVERGAQTVSKPVQPSAAPSETGTGAEVLLAMLAERDAATCCHSKATGMWARRLATAMGLPQAEVEFIELCALLHDIGKVATPDTVLLKAGPLTPDEWEIMKEHSAAGERILSQIRSLQRCAMIVRAHHERFDGQGYPDRLRGTEIPFAARVVAVADSFHAMISDRPYRAAIAPRQALKILEEGKGTQWDPGVVDAMIGLFERKMPSSQSAHVTSA